MSGISVIRVQDSHGRGPFRPGMTKRWCDPAGDAALPPFHHEFGSGVIDEMLQLLKDRGGAFGCAVASLDDLGKWFTATEQKRLAALRYQVVSMSIDMVLRESPNQIVFWRRLPLRWNVTVVGWPR